MRRQVHLAAHEALPATWTHGAPSRICRAAAPSSAVRSHGATCALVPDDARKELVQLLELHDVPLIEDDVYAELYFGSRRPKSTKAFDQKGLVLSCGSFSKSLAPGYRIGWVAAGRFARTVGRRKV